MPELPEIVIRSEADATQYLEQALAGAFDNLSVLIKFDGWPKLDLNVTGERYHSSIPTGLMKALVEYQSAINRAYASIACGKSVRGLTEDDRKEVELVFDVQEGSTDTEADLWGTLSKMGEKAVERMTGKQLVITVIGAALIGSMTWGSLHWMDTQAEITKEESKNELLQQVIHQNEHLVQLQADMQKTALSFVKGAYDAERISYGDVELNRPQIEAINQRSREARALDRIDGQYEVIQLKRYDDKWRIVLYSERTGQVQTDLYRGQKADLCIEEISLAFAKHTSVDLLLLGRYRAGVIQSATILGTTKSGLLEPDAVAQNEADDEDPNE